MEPEKSFPRPSPRCDRTAFLITNGGDAAAKNAQAPAEVLNVEGSSGGERREEEEILNQWECGELSRNFIRATSVRFPRRIPRKDDKLRRSWLQRPCLEVSGGLSVGPSGGAPQRGQGLRAGPEAAQDSRNRSVFAGLIFPRCVWAQPVNEE